MTDCTDVAPPSENELDLEDRSDYVKSPIRRGDTISVHSDDDEGEKHANVNDEVEGETDISKEHETMSVIKPEVVIAADESRNITNAFLEHALKTDKDPLSRLSNASISNLKAIKDRMNKIMQITPGNCDYRGIDKEHTKRKGKKKAKKKEESDDDEDSDYIDSGSETDEDSDESDDEINCPGLGDFEGMNTFASTVAKAKKHIKKKPHLFLNVMKQNEYLDSRFIHVNCDETGGWVTKMFVTWLHYKIVIATKSCKTKKLAKIAATDIFHVMLKAYIEDRSFADVDKLVAFYLFIRVPDIGILFEDVCDVNM
jgi:hypothetical protein